MSWYVCVCVFVRSWPIGYDCSLLSLRFRFSKSVGFLIQRASGHYSRAMKLGDTNREKPVMSLESVCGGELDRFACRGGAVKITIA